MNTNALAGMKCPQCGSEGPFHIHAVAVAQVEDTGVTDVDGFEWDDESTCVCRKGCGKVGTVAEFHEKEDCECDACGALVASIIGCPDGREVCQECFDKGVG